ncbi:MAG: hypothetical protein PHC90_06930 [Syntrophorhabdaceae bacterium]|nr:hypothetical protein [Syntrophorhabdaceae bacterium]
MGKAIPGALLRMWEFLPDDIGDALLLAVEKNRDAHKNFRGASVSRCPHCGDSNTMDCSTIDAIGDATVGLCLVCGYLWCLECDSSLITGINCGHWQICSSCPEKKQSSGYCGTLPWECPHIREWLKKHHPVV